MSLTPVVIWFLVGLVLVLSELALPGVILVFFGLGAWVTAVTCGLGLTDGLTAQLVVFGAGSLIMLAALRRWLYDKLHGHESADQDPADNLDNPAGDVVTVTAAVSPECEGSVEYKGSSWSARSDTPLAEGQRARIVDTDGITLVVAPLDNQ